MLTKIKVSERQREELRNAYFCKKVRYVAFCNGMVKCYSENSKLLYEKSCGPVYEVASQLHSGEVVTLTDLINAPSSE